MTPAPRFGRSPMVATLPASPWASARRVRTAGPGASNTLGMGTPGVYKERLWGCLASLNPGAAPAAAPLSPPRGNLRPRHSPSPDPGLLFLTGQLFSQPLQQRFILGNSRVIHRFICRKEDVFSNSRSFPCGRFLKYNSDFNPDVLSFISVFLNVSFSACVCGPLSEHWPQPFRSVSLEFTSTDFCGFFRLK